MRHALWSVALAGCLLAACDDALLAVFEPQPPVNGVAGATSVSGGAGGAMQPGGEAGTPSPSGGSGGDKPGDLPAGAGGLVEPNDAPLIDDFEDGNSRAKEPRGWWYPINDGTGTQGFGIEPVSAGDSSVYALRTHGSGFTDWGAALGVDLLAGSTPVDASSFQKLCFLARVESDSSTAIQVHFLARGAQHYVQDVSLSETWTSYCLPLLDFIGPNNAPLVPKDLIALQFFFAPKTRFVMWLDDVTFAP